MIMTRNDKIISRGAQQSGKILRELGQQRQMVFLVPACTTLAGQSVHLSAMYTMEVLKET